MESPVSCLDTDAYLRRIVEVTRGALGGMRSRGYLFGSRATGRAQPGSDYDIAVASDLSLDDALARARFELEESTIPFEIDLVDLAGADVAFRDAVLREGVPLWTE